MRDLHRLVVLLDNKQKRRIFESQDRMAFYWFEQMGIIDIVRRLDEEHPLLILRHDFHYERFRNAVEWNIDINTGYLSHLVNIEAYFGVLDSLIEGKRVTFPSGTSFELKAPEPVHVVLDAAPERYRDYFEQTGEAYKLFERVVDVRGQDRVV